jgi:hypothetical protein
MAQISSQVIKWFSEGRASRSNEENDDTLMRGVDKVAE